ncbi:MAG: hypothetical protein WBD20_15740 [Pirellulaceae bacterium]
MNYSTAIYSAAKSIALMCIVLLAAPGDIVAENNAAVSPKPITVLPSGVKFPVDGSATGRWNRGILIAQSQIASGDVDKLASNIRDAATAFSQSIIATVTPPAEAGGEFILSEVGVGYTVPIGGTHTVVTESTANDLGANLGFISRKILGSSVTQLAEVKAIVHTSTLFVFDAPSVMLRGDKHLKYVMRHMIWIDPKSGDGAAIVWLLGTDATGKLTPVNEPLRLFPNGTKETRRIHVDGKEFSMFGFPNERALAMEDLPPGKKVPWNRELAEIASLPSYAPNQVVQLSTLMNAAITTNQQNNANQK